MTTWFAAGGFGMFVVLAIGVASIVYGVMALRDPSAERLAALRSLPSLIVASALFTFGTNAWAVNRALESDAFMKVRGLTPGDLPVVGLVGLTEAVQVLTLGGLLAAIVLGLRAAAEASRARRSEA
jgi:hypothetical protein